jgi:hypothetical protein
VENEIFSSLTLRYRDEYCISRLMEARKLRQWAIKHLNACRHASSSILQTSPSGFKVHGFYHCAEI